MWRLENRPKYNRDHLRYPSDLTDDEWAYVVAWDGATLAKIWTVVNFDIITNAAARLLAPRARLIPEAQHLVLRITVTNWATRPRRDDGARGMDHVDLFSDCERVINFNAKILHCAFEPMASWP
jgi:hypothetical protein